MALASLKRELIALKAALILSKGEKVIFNK
jgi:hypothetical protein